MEYKKNMGNKGKFGSVKRAFAVVAATGVLITGIAGCSPYKTNGYEKRGVAYKNGLEVLNENATREGVNYEKQMRAKVELGEYDSVKVERVHVRTGKREEILTARKAPEKLEPKKEEKPEKKEKRKIYYGGEIQLELPCSEEDRIQPTEDKKEVMEETHYERKDEKDINRPYGG